MFWSFRIWILLAVVSELHKKKYCHIRKIPDPNIWIYRCLLNQNQRNILTEPRGDSYLQQKNELKYTEKKKAEPEREIEEWNNRTIMGDSDTAGLWAQLWLVLQGTKNVLSPSFLLFKLIHHTISIFLVSDKFHLKTASKHLEESPLVRSWNMYVFFSWKRLFCPAGRPAFFPQAIFLWYKNSFARNYQVSAMARIAWPAFGCQENLFTPWANAGPFQRDRQYMMTSLCCVHSLGASNPHVSLF